MKWKELATALRPFAPAVARTLATGNPVANLVVNQVAKALNVPATEEQITAAIASDPDAAERIARIEAEVAMAGIADVAAAREAHRGHWMPAVMTLGLMGMMCAAGYALLTLTIPAGNEQMVNIAFGAFLNAFGVGVAYWLGSSRGSAEKQEMMRVNRAQED